MNTTEQWILGTGIVIGLAFIALGYAAMSTNPPHTIRTWVPKIWFSLAIAAALGEGIYFWDTIIFAKVFTVISAIGMIFYLGWPMLKRMYFQTPIKIKATEKKENEKTSMPGIHTNATENIMIGNPDIIAPGIYFYPNREKAGGLLQSFAESKEIDALWFTGFDASNYLSTKLKGKIRRLILVNPNYGKENLTIQNFIINIWGKTIDYYYNHIKNFSDDAIKEGIKVYWLSEILQYGMVISDRHDQNAWVKFEKAEFTEQTPDWPSILVARKEQGFLYNVLISYYEKVLNWAQEYPQCLQNVSRNTSSKEEIKIRSDYYSGFVYINGQAASNVKVVAKVDDYSSAAVYTNKAGYYRRLEIHPPDESYIGFTTDFYVNDKKVPYTSQFERRYMGGGQEAHQWILNI